MNEFTQEYWAAKFPKGAIVKRTTRFEKDGVPQSSVETREMTWYELWLNQVGEEQHRWDVVEAIEAEEKKVAPKAAKPAPKPAPKPTPQTKEDGEEEGTSEG